MNNHNWPDFKRRMTVVLSVCALLGTWCWVEARSLDSKRDSHQVMLAQTAQMNLDAERIGSLRAAPQLATERARPNDELLAEVRACLAAANVPLEHWIGNDPSPSVRVPRSPYKRLSVRLLFERLDLRQLVQFAYHLTEMNRALSIPYLRLFAPHDRQQDTWNVDMSVSYLIYSPCQERRR